MSAGVVNLILKAFNPYCLIFWLCSKGKAIPVQAQRVQELRLQYFKTVGT